jgi:creatinine amidohydrolase/Fe(II)-dependent formamide hydrolase-like protein
MYLERMKMTDFDLQKKYTFVVPMGATEQHGPFLPLGTDSFLQDEIIRRTEEAIQDVIFLPTMRVTCSREHEGFPGSVWIEKDTMELVLRDICESLRPYAKDIVFVSWHGGNIGILNRFVEKYQGLFADIHLEHIPFDSEDALKKTAELLGGPVDEHAGNSEISMVLACTPGLVGIPPADYPKHKIENAWDKDRLVDVSKDGIVDNHPSWVIDKKIGEQCIRMATEELVNGLQKVLKTK